MTPWNPVRQPADVCFALLVSLYFCLLIVGASFGVVDDHGLLNSTLVGKFNPLFMSAALGRFYPLNGYEYNLISLVSNSPSAYYAYNAVQLVVVLVALYKLLIPAVFPEKQRGYVYLLLCGVLILPGFITAWFRLFVPERNMLTFFLIFLVSYVSFSKTGRWGSALLAVLSANLALYNKETGFLMLGVFVVCHLVLGWRVLKGRQKALDTALLLSVIGFLSAYFFLIYIHRGEHLYGATTQNPLVIFTKNAFNFLLSDPFLILLLPTLIGYRIFLVFFRAAEKHPVYDALLIASLIYILAFLKLNIPATYYYLLPAYAFGILGMAFFLFKLNYLNNALIKLATLVSLLVFVISAVPLGVHQVSYYKNVPRNFQKSLSYLSAYIPEQHHRVSIYLDGTNRGTSIEVYHSFIENLKFRGLGSAEFDFKSDEESDNPILFSKGDTLNPYTVFQNPKPSVPVRGDLLIITPYSQKFFNEDYLEELTRDYKLLYKAPSILAVPNFSAKSLIKYLSLGKVNDETMANNNVFDMPLGFYVFKKD